jgi:DDE superfamily endonuclease
VAPFVHSSFGMVVMTLFQGFFSAPSWQTFTYLACGWSLATDRHTITTYVWLTGATAIKHFSRFYVFLGGPLYHKRWQLWGAIIRLAARFVPEGVVLRVVCDDTTKKKTGTHSEGLGRYRNGAGSARQEDRTLRGLNFVLGIMRIPLTRWPGHSLSIPVGLELYLNPDQAKALNGPYRSRSQLARAILDFVAEQLPEWPIRSLADGGYATKDYVRQLPKPVHIVGRFPLDARLYQLPPKSPAKQRGAPRKKGDLIGSPKLLAQTAKGWAPHPSEAGAEIQAWCGLGDFCESWCSGVQPTDAPNRPDKENHLRSSKPFSPPI